MKKITLLLLLGAFISMEAQKVKKKERHFGKEISVNNISPDGKIRCLTDEYELYLQEKNSKRLSNQAFENWINPLIQKYKEQQTTLSQSGGIIYIPVVVHVIHNGDAYATNENIADEQVQSQITVMNQDFRKMAGTPGFNTNTVGADTTIEFVLAKVDPNGNPTNGINRVNLCTASWSTDAVNSTVKPTTIWDPTQYMNMWSVNFSDPDLLGYAQFPSNSTLTGLNASGGSANTDGVVAGYPFFGSRTIYPSGNYGNNFTYDKGRTMTHEVGHYLGLRHIWGDGGCNVDDFCNDTPVAGSSNFGCPNGTDSCPSMSGVDMIENYMDYTNDSCMNIFTNDQKTRMLTVMNNSPRRVELKSSVKDIAIPLFANDGELKIENSCGVTSATCASGAVSPAKTVLLYNRGTSNITSAQIGYSINGSSFNQNFVGNIAPNKYAVVTLINSTTNGTLNVTINNINGTTDQRSSNNTDSKTFGSSITNANSTSFIFNLVSDRFGDEISWTLKNQVGTTLYSGGPYADGGTGSGTQVLVNNQVWSLPANGCYTLTITDTFGDGLYDGVNQGYYTVVGGGVTVINVPDFAVSGNPNNTTITKSNSFTNNALSIDDSNLLKEISLYPIPTRDILNVSIPETLGSVTSYEIFNNLGQIIDTKNASNNNFTVSTSKFSDGVYFIKLNFENTTKTVRFVKN